MRIELKSFITGAIIIIFLMLIFSNLRSESKIQKLKKLDVMHLYNKSGSTYRFSGLREGKIEMRKSFATKIIESLKEEPF